MKYFPPLVGLEDHQPMGSSTHSEQWSCSAPDSQYRVSKSHPSSIPTRLGSHRVIQSNGCDLYAVAPKFASWFHRSLEWSANRLVHWAMTHLGSNRWSVWPDIAEAPLRGRWRCLRTPPRPCPYVVVVWRGPDWRSWPPSFSFLEGVSWGKQISQFWKWAHCIVLQ